jgi:hypothetical protein
VPAVFSKAELHTLRVKLDNGTEALARYLPTTNDSANMRAALIKSVKAGRYPRAAPSGAVVAQIEGITTQSCNARLLISEEYVPL